MDQIWWKQITKANHFIKDLAATVLDSKSVILNLPEFVPWQDTMYEMVEGILNEENPEYRLVVHECPTEEAGQFLLEEFCKKDKRASYRYGMSYASFLAQSEGIVLNSRYIWIKNVTRDKLEEWSKFILEYNKNLPKHRAAAVFILETHETDIRQKALKGIRYINFDDSIDSYDKFTFCALSSTEISIKGYLRPYLAELVSTVCKDDIELCALCINRWNEFLSEPISVLSSINDDEQHSDGTPFTIQLDTEYINTLIWESQVKYLFPIVERYRSTFVKNYYQSIEKALPIKNSYGETITNPLDIELGSLIQMAAQKKLSLNTATYTQLDDFRHIRNDLAHITPIEFSRVDRILSLKI